MIVSRRQFLGGSAATVALAAAPGGWYAGIYEPQHIELVQRSFPIRGLLSKFDGFTLAQVSDLHIVRTQDVHIKMIQLIQQLKPNALIVTGDFVDDRSAVGEAVDLISNVHPSHGTWAVPGNWDHTAQAVDDLQSQLQAANARLLVNENAQLDKGLWLAGVDDPASDHDDLATAVNGIPSGVSQILLAHSPDIVRSLDQHQFDLVLCGHTHGGQINLPFLNGAWLKNGPTKTFIQGMYSAHGSPVYVNRGIGVTTIPVRIHCRPEVTLWTLRAA